MDIDPPDIFSKKESPKLETDHDKKRIRLDGTPISHREKCTKYFDKKKKSKLSSSASQASSNSNSSLKNEIREIPNRILPMMEQMFIQLDQILSKERNDQEAVQVRGEMLSVPKSEMVKSKFEVVKSSQQQRQQPPKNLKRKNEDQNESETGENETGHNRILKKGIRRIHSKIQYDKPFEPMDVDADSD